MKSQTLLSGVTSAVQNCLKDGSQEFPLLLDLCKPAVPESAVICRWPGIGPPKPICHCCSFVHCPRQVEQGSSATLTKIQVRRQWTSNHPVSESCTFRIMQKRTTENQQDAESMHPGHICPSLKGKFMSPSWAVNL